MSSIAIPLPAPTSPTAAGTAANTAAGGFSVYKSVTFKATITGATGGTLDVYVQHSADNVVWDDYIHFPQAAAAAAAVSYSYDPALNDSIVTVGGGTTPALAAGSVAGGHPMDYLRVLYVAGASTSAGAAQSVKVLCTGRSDRCY